MRNAYKNDFQVKELFLETAKHYPWFCWEAEKFLCYPNIMKDNLNLHWDTHTTVGWRSWKLGEHVPRLYQEIKCHSKETIQDILTHQQIFLEPSFFPLHTSNSGHNCVLLQRQVELKLQSIILHILRMHKEYKHKMWNGNISVGRANQTCGMGTAEWQWRAEHGRFLCLWHLSETCLNVCILYTNVYNTKEKCSDKPTFLKLWIPMDIKKYNSPPLQPLLQEMIEPQHCSAGAVVYMWPHVLYWSPHFHPESSTLSIAVKLGFYISEGIIFNVCEM